MRDVTKKKAVDFSNLPAAPLHRFPASLRCPAIAVGKAGVVAELGKQQDWDGFFEPPPQNHDQAPESSNVSKLGLHSDLPQKTLNELGPLGLSFFVPHRGAEDVWDGAHALMGDLLGRSSERLTCMRLDSVPQNIADKFSFVPDEILGVSASDPFAVHVSVTPIVGRASVSDMQGLALCRGNFRDCISNSVLGGGQERTEGQRGHGKGDQPGPDAGTGVCPCAVLADGHGVYADVVISLLEWALEEEKDPNVRFLAYLFQLDIEKHCDSLSDNSAEDFAECLGTTLRKLIVRGYNISRGSGGVDFSLTERGVATEKLLALIGEPRESLVGHWGNCLQDTEARPGKPIELPLGCSSPALLMARSFGGRAMLVPGSMTIKVSGLPPGLANDVAIALESDEVFHEGVSAALKDTACVARSSLRAPYFFVSKSSVPAPIFQRCDATPLSDEEGLRPLAVSVFRSVECKAGDLVTASNAGRSLLSLMRGELAPDQRFRWWPASSDRPVDFMAMWPSDSPTLRQHWWAATIQRHVLEAYPSLSAGSSGTSVQPSEGESFFFLLTWSSSFRKEAFGAIDAMLRDLHFPASRTSLSVTFR